MITLKVIHGERHTTACLKITEQSGIDDPLIRTVNPGEELELAIYSGCPLVIELEEIRSSEPSDGLENYVSDLIDTTLIENDEEKSDEKTDPPIDTPETTP